MGTGRNFALEPDAQDTLRQQPLASFEYSTPPSPLRAGAPAWRCPGRLRRPLKARFDRRFYPCPSGDLDGDDGCVADRASAVLEPPARRGQSPAAPICPAADWTVQGSRALRGCGPARRGGAARSKNASASSKGSSDFWAFERCRHLSFADDERIAG